MEEDDSARRRPGASRDWVVVQ